MRIVLNFISTIIIILANSLNAANFLPISNGKLYLVHSAIFDTFNPFTEDEQNTTIKHLLSQAKSSSFEVITHYQNVVSALFLLNNLNLLHNQLFIKFYYNFIAHDKEASSLVSDQTLSSIEEFIKNLPQSWIGLSIIELTKTERLELFSRLINSEINILRQIGFYVRMFYNQALYEGSISEKISNHIDPGNKQASIVPNFPKLITHMRYNHSNHHLEGHLDAIIVGSGPAGSTAAHELQRQGLKILVVESGPLVIPGAIDTTSDLRFMEGQSTRIVEDGSIALLNGEAVGGGTTVNLDMSFSPTMPIVRHRFHRWHEQGLIPETMWTDDKLDKASAWVDSIFEPRTIEHREINKNNEILINGASILGIPYKRYTLNTYKPGSSPHEVYSKKSSFEKLLLPSMMNSNYPTTLLSDCQVTKVLMKKNKAYGVECVYEPKLSGIGIVHDMYNFQIPKKTKIKIIADTVILAGGNLGSSAILLNSNIDNPNIGRGFVTHPLMPLMGKFDYQVNADQGEPSTVFIDHFMPTDENREKPGYLFEVGLGKLSLWSLLNPGNPEQVKENLEAISYAGGFSILLTDTVNHNNRIEIGSDNKIKVHYKLSIDDKKRMIEAIKKGIEILFAAGAKEVWFASFEKALFQNSKLIANPITPKMDIDTLMKDFYLTPNQTILFGGHMMSGNKLGVNPKNSVVNGDYQVWQTENLYLIDASIFPESVGANPMQTIYTTAKIFADQFMQQRQIKK